MKSTQPVCSELLTLESFSFHICINTIQSWTETDMGTIILNYNNVRFNLKIMVDWILLRLTVTMMRSGEWLDLKSKGKLCGCELKESEAPERRSKTHTHTHTLCWDRLCVETVVRLSLGCVISLLTRI